jgi:hypothetical protein
VFWLVLFNGDVSSHRREIEVFAPESEGLTNARLEDEDVQLLGFPAGVNKRRAANVLFL